MTNTKRSFSLLVAFAAVTLVSFSGGVARAADSGHLTGLIQNEAGNPLPDVLVSLFNDATERALPIFARTNQLGHLVLRNIDPGRYRVIVRSSRYRIAEPQQVEVLPGKTAVLSLVLQQVFRFEGSDQDNVGVKSLLRTNSGRRLIFRQEPGLSGGSGLHEGYRQLFDEVAFEMYSDAGLGGDYLVFPGDTADGFTSNFAARQSLSGLSDYTIAGQVNSGEDSLWRMKNILDYHLSDLHTLRFSVGYSRVSFDQPSLSLLSNPVQVGSDNSFMQAPGIVKMLSLGVEDRVRFGEALTFSLGLDYDQVRSHHSYSFLSPNAALQVRAFRNTDFTLLATSRRNTRGNSLRLPEGDEVTVSNPVYISRIGKDLDVGTARHYQAGVTHHLREDTQVELSAFENQLFGSSIPILALFNGQSPHNAEVFLLNDDQARNSGTRFTVRHRFGENLNASFSYVQGMTSGLNSGPSTVLVDESLLETLIDSQQHFSSFASELEAFLPTSQTRLTALIKVVPGGSPLTTLDTLSDVYETSNEGVSLFVRQMIPMPQSFLNLMGLDFLGTYRIEALVDVRNLLNQHLGVIHTSQGDLLLFRSPRSVRGGIALKF